MDYWGLKYIRIVASPKASAVAYVYLRSHDSIYLNFSYAIDRDVLGHEAEHAEDGATCGEAGAANDPGFWLLNGTADYDVQARHDALSREAGAQARTAVRVQLMYARKAGDAAKIAQLQAQHKELEHQVVFITNADDVVEDKAETGGALISRGGIGNEVSQIFLDDQPRLQAKLIYLLARRYQHNPALTTWAIRSTLIKYTLGENPYINALTNPCIPEKARRTPTPVTLTNR